MGQKVNPYALRLGKLYSWKSRWFADDANYQKFLLEDLKLRKFLTEKLKLAGVVSIDIERSINKLKIIIYVSRPGVVIGRGGSGLEILKKFISRKIKTSSDKTKAPKLELEVKEVKKADLSAEIVAIRIADQLAKRYPHRRATAQAIEKVMTAGAKGIKIALAGRIGGAEIGRTEKFSSGTVPLGTLRADIDFAKKDSLTKSGYVGVKVWIYKGEKEIK